LRLVVPMMMIDDDWNELCVSRKACYGESKPLIRRVASSWFREHTRTYTYIYTLCCEYFLYITYAYSLLAHIIYIYDHLLRSPVHFMLVFVFFILLLLSYLFCFISLHIMILIPFIDTDTMTSWCTFDVCHFTDMGYHQQKPP
jgi:hypothetical protein